MNLQEAKARLERILEQDAPFLTPIGVAQLLLALVDAASVEQENPRERVLEHLRLLLTTADDPLRTLEQLGGEGIDEIAYNELGIDPDTIDCAAVYRQLFTESAGRRMSSGQLALQDARNTITTLRDQLAEKDADLRDAHGIQAAWQEDAYQTGVQASALRADLTNAKAEGQRDAKIKATLRDQLAEVRAERARLTKQVSDTRAELQGVNRSREGLHEHALAANEAAVKLRTDLKEAQTENAALRAIQDKEVVDKMLSLADDIPAATLAMGQEIERLGGELAERKAAQNARDALVAALRAVLGMSAPVKR